MSRALALLLACGAAPTPQAEPSPAESASMPAPIHVSPEHAAGRGMPAVGLEIEPGPGLSGRPFPEEGVLLTLSGPPGGLLLLQVFPAGEGGESALADMVVAHFDKPWWKPFALGEASTLELDGAARPARAFTTQAGPARASWCAALLPGLLVAFGHATGEASPTCAEIAAHPQLAPALASLRAL